jgi:hypothetical protein
MPVGGEWVGARAEPTPSQSAPRAKRQIKGQEGARSLPCHEPNGEQRISPQWGFRLKIV